MTRLRSLIPCILALILLAGPPVWGAESPAIKTVDRFHATLLDVMQKAKALGFQGRYDILAPAVSDAFALKTMAELAAGSYWAKLSTDQRERMVRAFSHLTIATYAYRFTGFSGEKFKTLGEVAMRRGSVLVRSELVKPDGETVELNYLLRQIKDNWQIVDIFLKGNYSELATRRAEYGSVLRRSGFDKLVSLIDSKAEALASGRDKKP